MLSFDVRAEQEQSGARLVERLGFSSSTRDCIQQLVGPCIVCMIPIPLFDSTVVSLMLQLIYGYEVKEDYDAYMIIANRALAGLAESATPGAFLVDTLPFCIFLPSFS